MSKVGDYLRGRVYGRPSDPTPSNQSYEPSNSAGWVVAIGSLISALASCNCAWPPTDANHPARAAPHAVSVPAHGGI
jgi:hypothetical protein